MQIIVNININLYCLIHCYYFGNFSHFTHQLKDDANSDQADGDAGGDDEKPGQHRLPRTAAVGQQTAVLTAKFKITSWFSFHIFVH